MFIVFLLYVKLWLEVNPIASAQENGTGIIVLNVPVCYYANAQEYNPETVESEAYEFPNKEFTLILDDLRAHGYGKRHYGVSLTTMETIEALREISKVHAIAWAMTEHSHEKVLNWPDMLKWNDLYVLHLEMIQQGFKHIRVVRKELQDKSRIALLDDLLKLEPKLPTLLEALLKPLPPPAVTSLIHMDFWSDNLLFKENHHDEQDDAASSSDESKKEEDVSGSRVSVSSAPRESSPEVDIDCMIVDWQMVSLGRISHDLGVLMITSLDASVRREFGMTFVKFYYDTFEVFSISSSLVLVSIMDKIINISFSEMVYCCFA